GLVEGFGRPLLAAALAAGFVALDFTAFLATALVLAFAFLTFFFAIVVPFASVLNSISSRSRVCDAPLRAASRPGCPCGSFLLQRALRIEVADAAALAAGTRIEHRVDERRLAGIHRRVHRAL